VAWKEKDAERTKAWFLNSTKQAFLCHEREAHRKDLHRVSEDKKQRT